MGSFFAYPQFTKKYGVQGADGSYEIPAPWQSGISSGTQVGSIIGLFINGIVSERYGYRKTLIGAMMLMIATIFIPFFAPNIEAILAGAILMGIPWVSTLVLTSQTDQILTFY